MGGDNEPEAPGKPIRKSVRRLRWFVNAFEEQVRRTSAETGNTFHVDEPVLSAVFVDWLRAFEAQKPGPGDDRVPYVGFAAGLMLRTLIRHKPVAVVTRPAGCDDTNPAYFWPEGYLYVAFCLNVRGLVLEHDFHETQQVVPELGETRTWWSFKENVDRDPSLAIAFLDLFAGDAPQWSMPEIFRPGATKRIAGKFYHRIEKAPVES